MAPVTDENSAPAAPNLMRVAKVDYLFSEKEAAVPSRGLLNAMKRSMPLVVEESPTKGGDDSLVQQATPARGKRRKLAATKSAPAQFGSPPADVTHERRPLCESDGFPQGGSDEATQVSVESLEAYKAIIGFQARRDCPHAPREEDNRCFEWSHPTSGVIMGYAMCTDEELEEVLEMPHEEAYNAIIDSMNDLEDRQCFEATDPATGVVMGYAVCSDEELEHVIEMPHEEAYRAILDATGGSQAEVDDDKCFEWSDPTNGVVLGYGLCTDEELGNVMEEEVGNEEGDAFEAASESVEWQDPSTGVVMEYAACTEEEIDHLPEDAHDGEFGTHLKDASWRDPSTGAIVGYEVCGEDIEDETLMQMGNLEWQDPDTKTMMGYMLWGEDGEEVFEDLDSAEEADLISTSESDWNATIRTISDLQDSASDSSSSHSGECASSSHAGTDVESSCPGDHS